MDSAGSSSTQILGSIIDDRFLIVEKMKSNCGDRLNYRAVNVTNGDEVAVIIESSKAKFCQLSKESLMYRYLRGENGIPNVEWYGQKNGCAILIMDLLGPSLEDLFNQCSRRFSLKTILMLADQLIARLEFLHSKKFMHRDISPEYFFMGIGKYCNKVYFGDFGNAKEFKADKDHIPCKEYQYLIGSAKFASFNSHLGLEQSPRDDLTSLGYVLIYFARGNLPWENVTASTKKQEHEKICEMKLSTSSDKLCAGYPHEFSIYLKYCRRLQFNDVPNYAFLRENFRALFKNFKYKYDYNFDWKITEKPATSTNVLANTQKITDGNTANQQISKRDSDIKEIIDIMQKLPATVSGKPKPSLSYRFASYSNSSITTQAPSRNSFPELKCPICGIMLYGTERSLNSHITTVHCKRIGGKGKGNYFY